MLVLGCTHFPVLASSIREVLGANVTLVDSADTTARAVVEKLDRDRLRRPAGGAGTTTLLATDGVARFARVGSQFFGAAIDAGAVELIDL